MIHERKFTTTHDDFFRRISAVCPEISKASNVIFVTDNETAIRTGIHNNFPSKKLFLCWNHLLQDVKRWVRGHGAATAAETSYYVDSVRTLLILLLMLLLTAMMLNPR